MLDVKRLRSYEKEGASPLKHRKVKTRSPSLAKTSQEAKDSQYQLPDEATLNQASPDKPTNSQVHDGNNTNAGLRSNSMADAGFYQNHKPTNQANFQNTKKTRKNNQMLKVTSSQGQLYLRDSANFKTFKGRTASHGMAVTSPQIGSLNTVSRRKQEIRLANENMQLYKRLTQTKPSIQKKDHLRHEQRQKQLRQLVADGPKRQSVVQAARDLIISQTFQKEEKQRGNQNMKNTQLFTRFNS